MTAAVARAPGTPAQESPLVALLLALLLPRPYRLLRQAAASPSTPAAAEAAACRSACAPQTATPGAATPGAALPQTPDEEQDMRTVAHASALPVAPPVLAPPTATVVAFEARRGTARHTALLRWHQSRLLVELAVQYPRYPVIAGGAGGDGEA